MSEAGTLERLLLVAGEALQSLSARLQPDVFEDYLFEFGILLPNGMVTGPLAGPLAAADTAAKRIAPVVAPLRDALEAAGAANAAAVVVAGAAVATEIAATAAALSALATSFGQAVSGVSDPDLRARLEAFAAELPRRLLHRLILERLDQVSVQLPPLLAIAGLADDRMEPGVHGDPNQPAHYLRRIHFDRIAKLATDPSSYLRDVFGWGTPDFDAYALLERIKWWFWARGKRLYWLGDQALDPPETDGLDFLGFRLLKDTSQTPPGLAAEWRFSLDANIARETDLGDSPWVAFVESTSRFEAGLQASLAPDGRVTVSPIGSPTLSARAGLRLKNADGTPVPLLGLAGGTRLEVGEVEISVGIEGLVGEPSVQVATKGLNCVLDVGGGDSFLTSMSGGGRGTSDVSIGATWSPTKGLHFTGSAALEIAIPAHASIGPATIETIYFVSKIADGTIPFELSAAVRGTVGPFTAVVDHIGVELTTSFPEDGGNLGPVQLDARFKPPSGVGLSVDGGGFTGGGFLRIEPDKGEYSGTLELQFQDVIDVKAVGVLNTRLPDGSRYSLILVITAEFTPIQLSFGFTLNGVGGLLAVNRTVLQDQLRLGLRDGTLDSILFPKDVVANAPRIINDLQRVFPPQPGRFLIGPMGKLGWGTPTLVSLELGLILEIPRPAFFFVGILRMALPADDVAILKLQVNFVGAVDFQKKQASFDAVLFDSRLLSFTLTGGMAVRVYWGDNANLLLTAGGFNPAFDPPPMDLQPIDRLAIALFSGNPRLRAEAYFALTSNTVQFGAKIEIQAGVRIFSVYGFVAFDALITFDPFHFVAHAAGMVAVRSGSSTLFSIKLDLTLDGPSPFHAHVRASFEIGFIFTVTIPVSFDTTFGEARNTSLPPVSVRPLLEAALRDDRNWRASADARVRSHVSARELPAGAPVVPFSSGHVLDSLFLNQASLNAVARE